MNIALVSGLFEPFVGGVEVSSAHLARALRARGHKVTIYTSLLPGTVSRGYDALGTEVRRFSGWFGKGLISGAPFELGSADVVHVGGVNRLLLLRLAVSVPQPKVLVPHGGAIGSLSTAGQLSLLPKKAFDAVGARLIMRRFSRIVCLSGAEMCGMRRMGIPASQLVCIPNPVADEAFALGERESSAEDYVLYMGRLDANKNVGLIIEAAAHARVRVVVAGTGNDALVRSLSATAGRSRAGVQFLGPAVGPAKWTLLGKARCVILASIREVQPVVVLEAMAARVPVIVPEGIAADYVHNGITGLTYQGGSSVALADRLLELGRAATSGALAEMVRRAHDHVRRFNRASVVAQLYEECFEKCISAA